MKNRKHNSPLKGAAPGSPRRGGDWGKLIILVLFAACLFSLQSCIPKLSRFLLWNNDDGESSGNLLTETPVPFHKHATRAPNMTKLFNKAESIKGNKSQQAVTVKNPAANETLSATDDSGVPLTNDPDIALVAVLSMQRSSSTSLTEMAMTMDGTNPCVLSLQEIFSRSQHGNEMELYGKDLLQGEVYAIPPHLLRDFVLRVAKLKCVDQLKRLDRNNVCRNRCIVGFKEFEEQLSYEQHEWLWKNTPNMTIVVLERDVEARWKSRYFAEFKDDWNTNGFDGHKKSVETMQVPPMSVSATDEFCKSVKWNQLCYFAEKHNKWYWFIRDKLSLKERVEVSFEAAILNGGRYARSLIASALPFDFQELFVPPAEQILDPQLAFVAVVSMQRSSSTTLTSQILSTNKTNPCVISLNEVFINSPHQSGDAWPVDGRHLQNSRKMELKPVLLRDFLLRVAKRRCVEQLQSQDTNKCENRCIVTYKQFHEHLNEDQHKLLWTTIPNMTIAVLERNVQDRWKSRFVAEKTDDWNTHGLDWHKEKIKEVHIPPMNVSESDEFCKEVKWNQLCYFEEKHKEWFKLVRETTLAEKRVEVSFEQVVQNGGESARFKIAAALPLAFQPIVALE